MTPNFHEFAWVVCHSSGGKDSQTALRQVWRQALEQGYPLSQVVVSHQCLGRMEWKGTRELAQKQASLYGLRFEITRYRNKEGEELTLFDYIRKRKKWPDNSNRFCTSDFKRGPGNRLLTALSRERSGKILQVFGFRAQESPSRKKKKIYQQDMRASTGVKPVFNWLPIHHWSEEEVWADIKASGIPWHWAYDVGMPRLSCCFCIFAPEGALMIAGKHNPELLDEAIALEEETGHDFRHNAPLRLIKDKLANGEQPPPASGDWNM